MHIMMDAEDNYAIDMSCLAVHILLPVSVHDLPMTYAPTSSSLSARVTCFCVTTTAAPVAGCWATPAGHSSGTEFRCVFQTTLYILLDPGPARFRLSSRQTTPANYVTMLYFFQEAVSIKCIS